MRSLGTLKYLRYFPILQQERYLEVEGGDLRRARRWQQVLCWISFPLLLAGCIDEDPVGQSSTTYELRPQFSAATLPDELIFEDEPMLEIARVMPTFGGFYFNDAGGIEVLLTDAADLAEAEV